MNLQRQATTATTATTATLVPASSPLTDNRINIVWLSHPMEIILSCKHTCTCTVHVAKTVWIRNHNIITQFTTEYKYFNGNVNVILVFFTILWPVSMVSLSDWPVLWYQRNAWDS